MSVSVCVCLFNAYFVCLLAVGLELVVLVALIYFYVSNICEQSSWTPPTYVLIVMSDPTQITKLEEYKTQINAATVSNDEDGDLMDTVTLANIEVRLFQESKRTCNKFIPAPNKKPRTTVPAA